MQASTSPVMLPVITFLLLTILVAAAKASGGSPMSCSQMCYYIELGKDAYCGGRNLTEVPRCCNDSTLLDLRQNNLRTLEGHPFHDFVNLRFLDLSDNFLEELPSMAFEGAAQLEDVYLMNNRFIIIKHGTFKGTMKIRSIYISNNGITTVQHSAFRDLPDLRVLYLSQNDLTYISGHQFQHNTRLTHINLAHNQIEVLHKSTFKNLHNLEFLDLSYNKLQVFQPSIFGTLPNLRTLKITNNSLTSEILSDTLLNAPSLEEVDVRYNHIKTMPENLNDVSLAKLRLGNNLLMCDCSFKSLQELYLTRRGEEWVEDVYCASGQQLVSASLGCEEPKDEMTASSFQHHPTKAVNSDGSPVTPFILTTATITGVCFIICLVVIILWIKSCFKQRHEYKQGTLNYLDTKPPPYDYSKTTAPPSCNKTQKLRYPKA